ncbi:MAG: hypothetical protein K8823_174 [Cenarchaeum symbiont of Oopsacas minuta]|nr:hypothetical protein [Cenarchaeum symbiont of Oopsacas minuta]
MTSKFVAATMLIIIASAAATITGSSLIEQARVQALQSNMQIASIQLRELYGAQKAFIAFTIVNTGTSTLMSADLSFRDDVGTVTNITPIGHINPGESWKEQHFVEAQIDKNSRYVLYVNARSADGSELSVQATVDAV